MLSWGPEWEGTAQIGLWEPNRKLRSIQSGSGSPVTVEWTIETRGGKTILRLTQSSFSSGAEWENEFYDSTNYGWLFTLTNLRHYLERHAGEPRMVAWPQRKVELSREMIYTKLAGQSAFSPRAPLDICSREINTRCEWRRERCGPGAWSLSFPCADSA